MKKYLIITIGIFILFSCSNIPNKSITEPLSIEELGNIINKEPDFAEIYEGIKELREEKLKSEIDQAKFHSITYRDMYDFYKELKDSVAEKKFSESILKEWGELYASDTLKLDSVINYWEKYKEDNSLTRYVRIELVELYKEYYSYSGDVKKVNLGFKLTPLNGTIEQIRFSYYIKPKINEDQTDEYMSALGKSWCLSTSPFSTPTTRYWEVDYTNEKILKNQTISTFNRDYNIFIDIDKMRIDGKNISYDDLEIPKSIESYMTSSYPSIYKDDIIVELINKNYKSIFTYRADKRKEKLKKDRPKIYELLVESAKVL